MRCRIAKEPHFDQTVFDNGLLCQSEVGFQAELDVASIWERVRVFTLTGYKKGRRIRAANVASENRKPSARALGQRQQLFQSKRFDPADLLFESVQAFNKRIVARRRRFYPADVVAQLVAHGVEVFVGKGRAFTLLKLCVFPWDSIYIGKKKLRAYRDLSRSYIREQVKELLHPFCLICHASTTRKCADGAHQFCPALFFTVRKQNKHGQWLTSAFMEQL